MNALKVEQRADLILSSTLNVLEAAGICFFTGFKFEVSLFLLLLLLFSICLFCLIV